LCSNLFLYEKKYDEAMEYKVRSMMRGTENNDFYMEAELGNCSEEFIQNYPNLFKQIYDNSDYTPDEYIKYQFESDIGSLFTKKYYKQICELFLLLESAFEDVSSIGKDGVLREGDLFEIAYSFNECGYDDKALWLYEKKLGINKEDSSVLNNMALIYEKKGNIKKAKEMIIKAKSLDKDGIIVARNYSRLVTEGKNKETYNGGKENISQNKEKKKELSFDDKTSEIVFGEKKCPIPFGTNQYVLCKALFSNPIGEWIKEDDVVDNFFQGKDNRRSFYDAVRLINQKAKENINVKKLIIYSSNRAQLHKELVV
jgi:tetratricopeptide (TPR) repeat protein